MLAAPTKPAAPARLLPATCRAPRPARTSRRVCASASAESERTVIPGDPRLGVTLLGVATLLGPGLHLWGPSSAHALLGGFLTFQASRVRFRFSPTELDVVFVEPGSTDVAAAEASVESSGDNKLQGGGANRWSLASVVNWEFWWPGFPILVYYKETQTRPEGQPHFFPVLADGKKLYETMLARMPPSLNAKPPVSEWNLDLALEQTAAGRAIKKELSEEQVAAAKRTTGWPFIDK